MAISAPIREMLGEVEIKAIASEYAKKYVSFAKAEKDLVQQIKDTAAVAALPSITGEPVKTLPPAQSPRLVDAGDVRAIVETMMAKNWSVKREELRKLTE